MLTAMVRTVEQKSAKESVSDRLGFSIAGTSDNLVKKSVNEGGSNRGS
jgi:hypothetical protein